MSKSIDEVMRELSKVYIDQYPIGEWVNKVQGEWREFQTVNNNRQSNILMPRGRFSGQNGG